MNFLCRFFLFHLILIFSLIGSAHASSLLKLTPPQEQEEFVANEFVVKVNPNKQNNFLSQSKGSFFQVVRKLRVKDSLFLVKTQNTKSTAENISALKNIVGVELAEPNFIYSIPENFQKSAPINVDELQNQSVNTSDSPNDPLFNQLWGLRNSGDNEPSKGVPGADIDALRAWTITKGSSDILIAVIDTGIDYNHNDLKDNIWFNEAEKNGQEGVDDDGNGFIDDIYGYDFANNDSDPFDGHSHGTHCSGTIGAIHDNNLGVAGVMAHAKIMAVKFLSDRGSGTLAAAVEAINYATAQNVDIMSNSWGGGGFSQLLEDAIMNASEKGIVFVAAAGNSRSNNDQNPHYPSNYQTPNMVSVAAHNISDTLASFSSYGKNTVHVAAPGRNILSTVPNNQYASYSGTSMATPHVSGIIGLLLTQEGRLDHAALRERLTLTSIPVRALRGKSASKGRINAYNILTDIRPPRNEPDPSLWVDYDLSENFESNHPYENNQTKSVEINVPGAKYIRVHVTKYELETNYDYVSVIDTKTSELIEKVTGSGTNYQSEYIEGDSIKLEFKSDYSVNKWGFLIEKLEVQY